MKKAGEWERDLEKKLIRPVTGKKPLILNKSPYNPGGFFCSAATLCVFSVHVLVKSCKCGSQRESLLPHTVTSHHRTDSNTQ